MQVPSAIAAVCSYFYFFNDFRNPEVSFTVDTNGGRTAIGLRSIIPFTTKLKYTYTLDPSNKMKQSEFENLVMYENKHPIARVFARPLYVNKLPYPKISFK